MDRIVIAVEPGLDISVRALSTEWENDPVARSIGPPRVEKATGTFLPGVAEWLVIPLAVNMASSVLYDLVKRLVQRVRSANVGAEQSAEDQPARTRGVIDVEVTVVVQDSQRIAVVRATTVDGP